jgi:hypothetical protein
MAVNDERYVGADYSRFQEVLSFAKGILPVDSLM